MTAGRSLCVDLVWNPEEVPDTDVVRMAGVHDTARRLDPGPTARGRLPVVNPAGLVAYELRQRLPRWSSKRLTAPILPRGGCGPPRRRAAGARGQLPGSTDAIARPMLERMIARERARVGEQVLDSVIASAAVVGALPCGAVGETFFRQPDHFNWISDVPARVGVARGTLRVERGCRRGVLARRDSVAGTTRSAARARPARHRSSSTQSPTRSPGSGPTRAAVGPAVVPSARADRRQAVPRAADRRTRSQRTTCDSRRPASST
jgi:hypothetical protein